MLVPRSAAGCVVEVLGRHLKRYSFLVVSRFEGVAVVKAEVREVEVRQLALGQRLLMGGEQGQYRTKTVKRPYDQGACQAHMPCTSRCGQQKVGGVWSATATHFVYFVLPLTAVKDSHKGEHVLYVEPSDISCMSGEYGCGDSSISDI